jgi:hypothetical protein
MRQKFLDLRPGRAHRCFDAIAESAAAFEAWRRKHLANGEPNVPFYLIKQPRAVDDRSLPHRDDRDIRGRVSTLLTYQHRPKRSVLGGADAGAVAALATSSGMSRSRL